MWVCASACICVFTIKQSKRKSKLKTKSACFSSHKPDFVGYCSSVKGWNDVDKLPSVKVPNLQVPF